MPSQKSSAQKHAQRKLAYIAGLTAHGDQLEPKGANRQTNTASNPASKNQAPRLTKSGEFSPSSNITSESDFDPDPSCDSDIDSQDSMGSGGNVKLRRLAWCDPPFFFQVPHKNYPPTIIQIVSQLEKASRNYNFVLDPQLQTVVKEEYPQYDFSPYFPSSRPRRQAVKIDLELFNHVKSLHDEATRQRTSHDNGESPSYTIIGKALSYDLEGGERKETIKEKEQNDRQLECILCSGHGFDNTYLPIKGAEGLPLPSVKIDLVLRFRVNQKPFWAPFRRVQLETDDTPALSPFITQPDTLVVVPIEVKSDAGDGTLAEYQVCMSASALLECRYRWAAWRGHKYDYKKNPPFVIALTVMGHAWFFYIIYLGDPGVNPESGEVYGCSERDSADEKTTQAPDVDEGLEGELDAQRMPRIVIGPIAAGDTTTLPRTFALARFLGTLRKWARTQWADDMLAELEPPIRPRV